VIDRAIEVFGAAGVSDDFPLAYFYAWARVLRIVDGPDAVHRRSVARQEIKRVSPLKAPARGSLAAPLNERPCTT
jgi:acyl-CoA dehydrogenase